MKTRLRKKRDIYLLELEGHLNFQGLDYLNSICTHKDLKQKKIVFNLKSLSFVGSKGVLAFSETLDFVNKNNNLKICCASSEFEKVLNNEGLDEVLFKSEEDAISSFSSEENTPASPNENMPNPADENISTYSK